MKKRLLMIGSAASQLLCVMFTRDVTTTNPNESVSARAYRLDTALRPIIDSIFFWQKEHCKSSYDYDLKLSRQLIRAHEVRDDIQTKST